MGEKILVVDDEKEIADLIAVYLESDGYTVFKCYTFEDAAEYIGREEPDLAILDVMLPGQSGFVLCQKIRETHTYPIIMLTAKDAETDKITGLTLGADDYITKPFRPLEMMARVKAQLRRYKKYNPAAAQPEEDEMIFRWGLAMNLKTHECTLNGKRLELTPTEFGILSILCRKKGQVVSSEELFHELWQDEYYYKNNNTITVHIRHLREKLGDTADRPRYIRTVWGVGYRLEE